jgi:hypothetical protein
MDHIFKDINSEQEEARRKAIEHELIGNHDPTSSQELTVS